MSDNNKKFEPGEPCHVVFEMRGREMSSDGKFHSYANGKAYVEIGGPLYGIVEAEVEDVTEPA